MEALRYCPHCKAPVLGLRFRLTPNRLSCPACGAKLRWSGTARWIVSIVVHALFIGSLYVGFAFGSWVMLIAVLALMLLTPVLLWAFCPLVLAQPPQRRPGDA
jgi:hypothetical protein